MTEWWTYRPSDFLMFAPRAYWRLFESHNLAWWPAQLLLVGAGLAWLVWARHGGARPARFGIAALALLWAFVGWAFLRERYAPINWAASSFAIGFYLQAILLAALATRSDLRVSDSPRRRHIGLLLCAWALMIHPLLAACFGRPWTQAEVFGLAPDPTVIATLGALLRVQASSGPTRWLLRASWAVPIAWSMISAATLSVMAGRHAG